MLCEELKGPTLRDEVVEEANRLLTRDVSMFQARHPGLLKSKGLAADLVRGALEVLKLRYPNCFAVSPQPTVLEGEQA